MCTQHHHQTHNPSFHPHTDTPRTALNTPVAHDSHQNTNDNQQVRTASLAAAHHAHHASPKPPQTSCQPLRNPAAS